MKKLYVTIGQDLSAYATIEVSADTDLSEEKLAAIANKAVEDAVFDPDWSTVCALRVVSVTDQDGGYHIEDIAVEPSPYAAGQVLGSFLKGYAEDFDKVVKSQLKRS